MASLSIVAIVVRAVCPLANDYGGPALAVSAEKTQFLRAIRAISPPGGG
jgi:hypothetical protein